MARRRSLGKKRKSYRKTRNKKNRKTVRKTRRMRGGIFDISRLFKQKPTDAFGRTQKEADEERNALKKKQEQTHQEQRRKGMSTYASIIAPSPPTTLPPS